LDSRGECNLWLLPANAYKFILRDSADALIWTVDNINLGINFSNVIITGGTLNGVTIGNITPGTAVFTDLTATGTVTFNGVTQMQIPAGPTANRSTTPVDGMIRYNSTTDLYEGNNTVAGQTISTLQLSGTVTAILTTTAPHGLSTGDYITVTGATPAAYNSSYNITYISSTSFSYTMASNPGGNATVVGSYVAHSWLSFNTNVVTLGNRLINGNMVIDQRNAGASVTATTSIFGVDRALFQSSIASKFSIQQNAGAVTPPVGFTNYQGVTSLAATALGASDFYMMRQVIEGYNIADLGWGTANAKTVTLSFWVRSSLTGTFGGAFQNAGQDRSYPYTYTISVANTWEYKTVTVAGDTSGTWLSTNGVGIRVGFSLGTGSTLSGTAGAWSGSSFFSATGATSVVGTNGATFYITGVQLEVGSQATSFEYRQYGTELALCQRYFEMSFPQGTAPANGVANGVRTTSSVINTSNAYANSIMYVVQKRATPTVTTYNTDNGSSSGQAAYFVAGAWNNGNTTSTFGSMTNLGYNFGGTFTLLGAYYTDLHWIASAEL
jgi:hypothetical protein